MSKKTILEEAFEDAKLLKQTAIEHAKNVLVEAVSPKIKEFVESQLGESSPMYEKRDEDELMDLPGVGGDSALSAPMHGGDTAMPEMPAEEGGSLEDQFAALKAEVASLKAQLGQSEELGSDEEAEVGDLLDSDSEESEEEPEEEEESEEEEEKGMEDSKKTDEVKEEVVEITNEDLKAALSEVLGSLKEASVTKGFGDMKDVGDGGLLDKKSGEKHWAEEEAPAATDHTVKEIVSSLKRQVESYKKDNARLTKESAEYKKVCSFLKDKIQEVNLFNTKLLYTQKLLNSSSLNGKQRTGVIEAFDRAQSMREVELVYKSLSESFKIAGVLGESKRVLSSKVAKSGRFTTPSSTVLKDSMAKEGKEVVSEEFDKWQTLAGLVE